MKKIFIGLIATLTFTFVFSMGSEKSASAASVPVNNAPSISGQVSDDSLVVPTAGALPGNGGGAGPGTVFSHAFY
ncbi:hypothetical protein [Pseudogracilibacillus sp. SO10305]|uniref:hypothetical protein n=1 Tax=Pseudogracilibacillus sp. SO10305 TaxID=3098292 RepID=UPI00300E6B73